MSAFSVREVIKYNRKHKAPTVQLWQVSKIIKLLSIDFPLLHCRKLRSVHDNIKTNKNERTLLERF